jgi:predicted methyltransferase
LNRALAIAALALLIALPLHADRPLDPLESVVSSEWRTPSNRERDAARRPLEMLKFFEIAPEQTVVELWPGGGWLTEILAPLLRENGQLIVAGFDPQASGDDGKFLREGALKLSAKFEADPERYDQVETTVLAPPERVEIAPAASADRVLALRVAHLWIAREQLSAVLAAVHAALKPDGLFGIEENRADPQAAIDLRARNGYVNQAELIGQVEAAGFVLVESSELNANPNDRRNHPRGVWTLPPTLALGDKDRDKYLSIGESDRMLLKFRKREQ